MMVTGSPTKENIANAMNPTTSSTGTACSTRDMMNAITNASLFARLGPMLRPGRRELPHQRESHPEQNGAKKDPKQPEGQRPA